MYLNKKVVTNTEKGKKIITKLFSLISKKPSKFMNFSNFDKSIVPRDISDFIAGMTDRYAINLYKKTK